MSTSPTVLITGASRGIGKAIAHAFAEAGYELYLVCEKQFRLLEQLEKELVSDYGSSCHCFTCDISDPTQVEALFQQLPSFDVIVNNAGISYVGLLTDMSSKEWRRILSVNLDSLFYICKNAIPSMVRRKQGRIINISSVWGNRGASMEVAYSASKGGMDAFTKALARELAPSNIQVNAIALGIIDTDMNKHLSFHEWETLIEEVPANRPGTPQEVARLAVMLASTPKYLTGQIITMDGGWT